MATQVTESDTREMVHDLEQAVSGEVRFDKMSRVRIHGILPPQHLRDRTCGGPSCRKRRDVIALWNGQSTACPSSQRRRTSLGGQTVPLDVMNFSKYMNSVVELNQEGSGYARSRHRAGLLNTRSAQRLLFCS